MAKKIFVRAEKDDTFKGKFMVTIQTEGFPKTHGYVETFGDTVGIGGTKKDINEIAELVYKETKESNTDAKVILKKLK